jgi:DNA repair protein RAD7
MSRNNVRGPTSALTEFLRESGITPTTIARRVAAADAANANQPVAGPSNTGQNGDVEQNGEDDEDEGQTSPRRRIRTRVSSN